MTGRFDRYRAPPQLAALVSRWTPPPRLYLQTADGVEEPQGRRGRRYWVVGRGLCRFFRVPLLADASAAHQAEALRLQFERLSPFVETGSHAHFGRDFASLWLWDAEAVRLAAESVGADLRRLRALPETALMAPAGSDVRLVATIDGFEGQSWIDGGLAASHWWPSLPDARQWLRFLRGASVPHDSPAPLAPQPVRLDWLDRPWTRDRAAGGKPLEQFDLRLAGAGIGVVLLLAYCYVGGEWLRLRHDVAAAATAIEARAQSDLPAAEARAAALDNLAAIQALHGLDRYPSQLALMARVASSLPKNETHLTAWNWDRGQLEVTVAANHPLDARFFVRSLEQIDGFKNVAAQRAGGDNSLNIRLVVEPR
ncbi:MAG TPA: hypothetical protein VFA12_03505 [Stellaceae bacterium]|nr:hypothetical protein [Stellaceae bacterium]